LIGDRFISRAGKAARACAIAWREGGIVKVGRLIANAAYWRFHPRVRRWAAELPLQNQIDREFDERFGVDTAGEVPLAEVGITGSDLERGHAHYRPVWTRVLRESLDGLSIAYERFTFVDYGSGKGKALLLASDYPFEEIIGIEFADKLHQIASENVRRYRSPLQRCQRVRSECIDATQYEPPARPLVCFFFNPFDDPTMEAVLTRLRGSIERSPREAFIVYCNMRDVREHARVLRSKSYLVPVAQSRQYLICSFAAVEA
jgi:hypothetical protein